MVRNKYLVIITLNVNGLNAPIKRHRVAELIRKQNPYVCCLQFQGAWGRPAIRAKHREQSQMKLAFTSLFYLFIYQTRCDRMLKWDSLSFSFLELPRTGSNDLFVAQQVARQPHDNGKTSTQKSVSCLLTLIKDLKGACWPSQGYI